MDKQNSTSDKETDKLLNSLSASTHSPRGKYSAGESYRQLAPRLHKNKSRRLLPYLSAAAGLAIILLFSWMFTLYFSSPEMITEETYAFTKQITLPDGTQVTINNHSRLTYQKTFTGKTREVTLCGEGYFDVVKNAEKPFIVKTQDIHVEVLGTKFNVMAYAQDPHIETTLLEGSVAITNNDQSQRIILKPNESASYNKSTGMLTQQYEQEAKADIAWIDGTLLFNQRPLKEIALQLSHRYQVEITINDATLKEYKLTARFAGDESLNEILDLLSQAGKFTYEANTNNTIEIKPKK